MDRRFIIADTARAEVTERNGVPSRQGLRRVYRPAQLCRNGRNQANRQGQMKGPEIMERPTEVPRHAKPVKAGSRVIGYVGTKPGGPFGHYWGYELQADGKARSACGMHSPGEAIKHLREMDDRKTLPQKPWMVRTANGSTLIVEAATERQAEERARIYLRRWLEKEMAIANARAADADFDVFESERPTLRFGAVKL